MRERRSPPRIWHDCASYGPIWAKRKSVIRSTTIGTIAGLSIREGKLVSICSNSNKSMFLNVAAVAADKLAPQTQIFKLLAWLSYHAGFEHESNVALMKGHLGVVGDQKESILTFLKQKYTIQVHSPQTSVPTVPSNSVSLGARLGLGQDLLNLIWVCLGCHTQGRFCMACQHSPALCFSLSLSLSLSLSISVLYLSIYLSLHPSMYLSIYLPIYLSGSASIGQWFDIDLALRSCDHGARPDIKHGRSRHIS